MALLWLSCLPPFLFATRGPAIDLSSKESKDILEDSDDEPTKKKRVSESKGEEESSGCVVEFMGTYSLCVAKFPFPFFFLLFLLCTYQ